MKIAVYSTKSYDRKYFELINAKWRENCGIALRRL